jgi:hypothetical protein
MLILSQSSWIAMKAGLELCELLRSEMMRFHEHV